MIEIKDNGMVDARRLHSAVEVKTRFNDWFRNGIESIDLVEGKDFYLISSKSTGGRIAKDYDLTKEVAIEMCLISFTTKGKEIRKYLIKLLNQRQTLELITVEESAFAYKVINCLKYLENQKQAKTLHLQVFIDKNATPYNEKYINGMFNKYRTSINGWDKETVLEEVDKFLGVRKSSLRISDMTTQIASFDKDEAIRIAVLDVLFSKNQNPEDAFKFADMIKRLSNAMGVEIVAKNENNLFQNKDDQADLKRLL